MSQSLDEQKAQALSYIEQLHKAREARAQAQATSTEAAHAELALRLDSADQAAADHSAAALVLEPEIMAALQVSPQELQLASGSGRRGVASSVQSPRPAASATDCATPSPSPSTSAAEPEVPWWQTAAAQDDDDSASSSSSYSFASSSSAAAADVASSSPVLAATLSAAARSGMDFNFPAAASSLRAQAAAALGLSGAAEGVSGGSGDSDESDEAEASGKAGEGAAASASAVALSGSAKWRSQAELAAQAQRYQGLSGPKLEAARRYETYRLLVELDALIINDVNYALYSAKMRTLGLEPYARAVLWQFNIAYVFGAGGLLARALPHYRPRPGQISFARHVAQAMNTGKILMVEAGTGTGKTFSYLAPPLIAGRRILVSTGTKALQDQLTAKDIPNLTKMLGLTRHHHMALKGQSNYICRYLMEGRGMNQLMAREQQLINAYINKSAEQIDHQRYQATFGEINFPLREEQRMAVSCDSSLCQEMSTHCPYAKLKWQFLKSCGASDEEASGQVKPGAGVESTTASVSGLEPAVGPNYNPDDLPDVSGDHCFIFAARHEAKKRQIVAINHALFFGALQNSNGFNGVNSILPWPEVLVFDEAHTLPEVGRTFFTRHVSLRELTDLPNTMQEAFKGSSVSVNSGAFKEASFRYALLVRTLQLGLSVYDADKRNVLDFKYRHAYYPSSFELLGPCLIHPRERGFLGAQSALMPVLAELEAAGVGASGAFFAGLGIADQSSLLQNSAVLAALGIKGSSSSSSSSSSSGADAGAQDTASHLNNTEWRSFEHGLQQHYVKLFTDFKERQRGVHDYEGGRFFARANKNKPCLVPPNDKPMLDARFDGAGQPVAEPFFKALMADLLAALRTLGALFEANKEAGDKVGALIERTNELIAFVADFMTTDRNGQGELQWDNAAWVEITGGDSDKNSLRKRDYSYHLVVAPIDIGKYLGAELRKLRDQGTTIIFASATITVNSKFKKFCHDVGLDESEVTTDIVPSPFDYEHHACLLTSSSFPPPSNKSERIIQCIASVKDAIACVDGGVFFLTTSYHMMHAAAKELQQLFGHQRKILVQGQEAVPSLLQKFRADGQAILVGTSSFWEGVDVPGKALSLVIIDKLPFKTIGDPLQVARSELCAQRGGNYFADISVPEAIIMLRQGVGRLVRNEADTGALIIMDPRLHTGSYGKTFFNSLPPMRQVTNISALVDFLRQC